MFNLQSTEVLLGFLGLAILLFFALRSIEKNIADRVEASPSKMDDIFSKLVLSLRPWIYVSLLLLIGTHFINLPEVLQNLVDPLILILSTYQIILTITETGEHIIKTTHGMGRHKEKLLSVFSHLLGILVWFIGVLFILSNFGVNITALLAGFGIGGIAIAFAFQNILRDLFSYLTILLDQPINEGDIIEINGREGTVKHIGIKTTRLLTSGGEEIVIANDTITSRDLKNFGTAKKRRVSFSLFLAHETTQTKLQKLPEQMTELIESIEGLTHKSTYIKSITAAGVELTNIYYVKNRSFTLHRDSRTDLYTALHTLLQKEKITLVQADIVANQ